VSLRTVQGVIGPFHKYPQEVTRREKAHKGTVDFRRPVGLRAAVLPGRGPVAQGGKEKREKKKKKALLLTRRKPSSGEGEEGMK